MQSTEKKAEESTDQIKAEAMNTENCRVRNKNQKIRKVKIIVKWESEKSELRNEN